MAHTFDPRAQEAKAADLYEFKASLVYKVRTAKDMKKNFVSRHVASIILSNKKILFEHNL